jgi:hypothetical protein
MKTELMGKVLVRMAIDTLELPGGPTYMQLGTEVFLHLLHDTADTEG